MRATLLRLLFLSACSTGAACASAGAVPQPFPIPGGSGALTPPRPESGGRDGSTETGLVQTALALRGVPYRNGGTDPSGFDCSGFVWYVFSRQGIVVPRTVLAQFAAGRKVAVDDLRPGDLVFFDTSGGPASHVGLIVDGQAFVHAPSSRGAVRVERLASRYWLNHFVGARRLE